MTNTATVQSDAIASVNTLEIEKNLQSDLEAAKALSSLLDEENQVLRSSTQDINTKLSQVTEAKQNHINALESNALQRENWIKPLLAERADQSKQSNQPQMRVWLELLAQSEELEALWQKVEQYIEICQRLNMINGRLIGFRKQRGQRLAEILFGRPQTNTYSSNGHSESSRGSHSLVHA